MRNSLKLLPALLLGSALGACSMAGTGDYYADEYSQMQQQQMPHIYDAPAGCGVAGCAPQNSYPVAQPGYGHAPQTPNQHAYGQSVQGHAGYGHQGVPAYHRPTQGGHHGLRGPKQAYTYGSLGAVMYDVDSDLFGAQARLGWQSASFFGAEVEGTLGLTDESTALTIGADTFDTDLKVKNSIAGFGVARVPVSRKLNVLGRAGYHNTELSVDILNTTTGVEDEADFSTDGFAYGVGAEYALNPLTSIRADYTIYDYDGPDADAVSLAIARKF